MVTAGNGKALDRLRTTFDLGWNIYELRARVLVRAADPEYPAMAQTTLKPRTNGLTPTAETADIVRLVGSTNASLQGASDWRRLFSCIVNDHSTCLSDSSAGGSSLPQQTIDKLKEQAPYLNLDLGNSGLPALRGQNGNILLSNFELCDLTRRALNCLTLLYVDPNESLVPEIVQRNQQELMNRILQAQAIGMSPEASREAQAQIEELEEALKAFDALMEDERSCPADAPEAYKKELEKAREQLKALQDEQKNRQVSGDKEKQLGRLLTVQAQLKALHGAQAKLTDLEQEVQARLTAVQAAQAAQAQLTDLEREAQAQLKAVQAAQAQLTAVLDAQSKLNDLEALIKPGPSPEAQAQLKAVLDAQSELSDLEAKINLGVLPEAQAQLKVVQDAQSKLNDLEALIKPGASPEAQAQLKAVQDAQSKLNDLEASIKPGASPEAQAKLKALHGAQAKLTDLEQAVQAQLTAVQDAQSKLNDLEAEINLGVSPEALPKLAINTLSNLVALLLDTWDGFVRDTLNASGLREDNQTRLVTYDAARELAAVSWRISQGVISLEKTAAQDEAAQELARKWMEVFDAEQVLRVQRRLASLSTVMNRAYYSDHNSDHKQTPPEDPAAARFNPAMPGAAIQSICDSLDYWQRAVALQAARCEGSDPKLWGSLRVALIEQSNIWQSLMNGQHPLADYTVRGAALALLNNVITEVYSVETASVTEIVTEATGEVTKLADAVFQATKELWNEVDQKAAAVVQAWKTPLTEASQAVSNVWNNVRLFVLATFALVVIAALSLFVFMLSNPTNSSATIATMSSILAGIGALLGLKTGSDQAQAVATGAGARQASIAGVIPRDLSSLTTRVENLAEKAQGLSKELSASTGKLVEALEDRLQKAGVEAEIAGREIFQKSRQQVEDTLQQMNYSMGVSSPLIDWYILPVPQELQKDLAELVSRVLWTRIETESLKARLERILAGEALTALLKGLPGVQPAPGEVVEAKG